MKLQSLLSQISKIFGYTQRRRTAKLYRQWMQSGDLSPEAIPKGEIAEDIRPKVPQMPKIDTQHLIKNLLYLLLGVFIGASGVILIMFTMKSC